MRSLAAFISETKPDVVACCDVDAGDALATATRFDLEWVYRGAQALLWSRRIVASDVHEFYLPAAPLRAFERRGLLRVDGRCGDGALHVFATSCATDRSGIRDLRFTRTMLRDASVPALLLIAMPKTAIGFGDLGMQTVDSPASGDLAIAARGFELAFVNASGPQAGLGSTLVVRAS
jgi:hypothetical protein